MCNKCNPNPCGCKTKNTCIRDISTDSVVYDSVEVPCLGIQNGTPLTEVVQTIGTAYCDLKNEINTASAVITNIGTGEGVYAGDTSGGAKQLKKINGSVSVDVTSTSTEIIVAVDEDWLDTKINAATDQNIVFFNTTNPNTGSPVFTPNTPQDTDIIYTSSVNNSLWVWNGTAYVTYVPPSTTPFYLANTTTDAGGNKATAIHRPGSVGIGTSNPQALLHVSGTIRQGNGNAMIKANLQGDLIGAVAGTDYLTPTGSAAALTGFPTLNQNTTGNAATVTTIPTLSGDVTNTGNTVSLTTTGATPGAYFSPNLTVDAKGRITAISAGTAPRAVAARYASPSNTGTTPTVLYNVSISPNLLSTTGSSLDVRWGGVFNNPGNAKTLDFQFGSSSFTQGFTSNGAFSMNAVIVRTGTSTVRVIIDRIFSNQAGTFVVEWAGLDFTSSIQLNLVGTGTVTGDVTAMLGLVKYSPF